jgi:orotate phosphoribosyltransferase
MIRMGSLADRHLLALRIYERAHLTGSFALRSGATSSEYFDKYLFESDPRLLREIAQGLVALGGETTVNTSPQWAGRSPGKRANPAL